MSFHFLTKGFLKFSTLVALSLVLILTGCTSLNPDSLTLQPPPTENAVPTLIDLLPTSTKASTPTDPTEIPKDITTPTADSPAEIPTQTAPPPTPTEVPSPPAIILFIGDGMGSNHRLAATWSASGENGLLVMDNMPVHGLASTTSANRTITDSAAAATSISSGQETNNGYIGVDEDKNDLVTILEYAQDAGWATGLVSTVQLSHATPAAFAAHLPDRNKMVQLAQQMMEHKINVLLGGGENLFTSTANEGCYPGKGYQPNGIDLVQQAIEDDYTNVCTAEELKSLDLNGITHLLGFFGADQIRRPFQPTLEEMTRTAIEVLSQDPDGFFLMVEAGQIDWAAHDNQATETIASTLGLDAAVAQAKIFALGNPNTLIIVAADHETGGMRALRDGIGSYALDGPFQMPDGTQFWVDWSTGSHTGDPIPVTAQGPYSELLSGEYHLTRIFDTMFLMLHTESQ